MIRIQILGIGCKKSRALKANVLEALRTLPLEASLEEVTKVEDIVRYQILTTPALLINGEVMSEGYVPEVPELLFWFKHLEKPVTPMKNILLPTDFSDTAANAFRFAKQLAKQYNSHLTVLHIYHPYFDPENPLAGNKDSLKPEEAAQLQLEVFVGEHYSPANAEEPSLRHEQVRKVVRFGFAADEIVKCSEQFDLIVMGTTGDGDWLETVFGSVSSHVAQHARCPVLLIPPGARYNGFKTVVYASDRKSDDRVLIRQIVEDLALPADAVQLVHVQQQADEEYLVSNGRHELIPRNQQPLINVNLIEIKSNSVLKALNEYAENSKADLIIMNPGQRSFLEKTFHLSLTKRMVLKAIRPILVLHTNKKVADASA